MQPNHQESSQSSMEQGSRFISQYSHINFKLSHPLDKPIATEQLDHWLTRHLGVQLNNSEQSRDNNPRSRHAMHTISLAATLLQAAKIPIFDKPEVLRVSEDKTSWHASIRFPWLDGIPSKALAVSLRASLILLERLKEYELDDLSPQDCYQWLEQSIIPAITVYAPPGKSSFNILKSAHAINIPFFHLGHGIFSIGTGSKSKLLRKSSLDSDSHISCLAAQDKNLTSNILRSAGLPVPNHRVATSPEEAVQASKALRWPLVVKPLNLDRGEGITIDIHTKEALIKASRHALAINNSKPFLVEEMQKGICHRLVIVHGKLVYCVKRLPISVVGDGLSTVGDLIQEAQQSELRLPPWQRTGRQYCDDSLTRETLSKSNLNIGSVPNKGETINLRMIESTAWGGISEDITTTIHPDNARLAIAAAEIIRLGVAGIDIISTDLSVPWHENNATINEVNSSPLIGSGEISRKHMPTYLNYLLGENPTIPIIRLDKSRTSLKAARALQASKVKQGTRALIATSTCCIGPNGEQIQTTLKSLNERIRALLLDRNVDCIIALS